MSSGANSDFEHFHARWRAANAAAFAAAEKVVEAKRRWERGLGDLPSHEQIAEAQRLREIANRLLKAATQEQMTRPAPL